MDELQAGLHQLIEAVVGGFREAEAAAVAIVEEERRHTGVHAVDHAADIGLVAHRVERQQMDRGIADADQSLGGILPRRPNSRHHRRGGDDPHARRRQRLGGKVDLRPAEAVGAVELDLLERHGRPGDIDLAEPDGGSAPHLFPVRPLHLDERFQDRLRVIVRVLAADMGDLVDQVQALHEVGLALVKVNGFRIDQLRRADRIDLPDHRTAGGRLDDGVGILGHGAQAHPVAGLMRLGPVVSAAGCAKQPLVRERRGHLGGPRAEVARVLRSKRHLRRGAAQVTGQDVQVLRVDHRALRRLPKEILGVTHDELVHRLVVGDEEDDGGLGAAAGAARLLPGACDGAREADDEGSVEPADVDAQLQGIRAGDPQQLAAEQLSLDFPPLRRQVTAPVRLNRLCQVRPVAPELLAHIAVQQLGHDARPPEGDRLHPLADQRHHQPLRLDVAADAPGVHLIAVRRVPDHAIILRVRSGVVHHRGLPRCAAGVGHRSKGSRSRQSSRKSTMLEHPCHCRRPKHRWQPNSPIRHPSDLRLYLASEPPTLRSSGGPTDV